MIDLAFRLLSRLVSWYGRRIRARHVALKASPAWERLPLVGTQEGGDMPVELRNCLCCSPPSTLGRPIGPRLIYAAGARRAS